MPRKTIKSILAVTSLIALPLAVATPASADMRGPIRCGASQAAVSGSTSGDAQITWIGSVYRQGCGTVGVRVFYNHPGGASWTGWTYANKGKSAIRRIPSAVKSQHMATVNSNPNIYFSTSL